MKLFPPAPVLTVLKRLNQAGFEASVVGGCVRDSLMDREPHDWDVTTSALPQETKAVFNGVPVIETGIQHGTVAVYLDKMLVEVTTYRVDGEYSDHRHPDQVTFTRSLKEDLARRDFTCNALAYNEKDGVIDYFDGKSDITNQVIRCVGDPELRFREDALRILRGLRFASVLGFSIDSATAKAMGKLQGLLDSIARERIAVELVKLLCGSGAEQILREFAPVFGQILPELAPMFGFPQKHPCHCWDVWEHTLRVVSAVPPEPALRLAALFHDIGKPSCHSQNGDGIDHFYGHGAVSDSLTSQALHRLKFDNQTIFTVRKLVKHHDQTLILDPKWVRRQLNRLGSDLFFQLLLLKEGDCRGQSEACQCRLPEIEAIRDLAQEILAQQQCFCLKDLAVNGRDLIALGYEGPEIGKALKLLLDQVIDGAPNEKAALLEGLEKNPPL